MTQLLLAMRHGATALNDANHPRLRGYIEAPLDPTRLEEVHQSARFLKKCKPGRIVCSDLERTRDTAEIVRKAVGLEHVWPSASLRPWNYGELAGLPLKEGLPLLRLYTLRSWETPPGGESFDQFLRRWGTALRQLLAAASPSPKPPTLIVTHSRNLYTIPRILWGAKRVPLKGPPEPAEVISINRDAKGAFRTASLFRPKPVEGKEV